MPTDWKSPCKDALEQNDPVSIGEFCTRARHAINERAFELAREQTADSAEREELNEALRQLWMHEQRLRRER